MKSGVEVKKVDKQGRIILPSDWRKEELKETDDVFVIKEKGILRIIPKKKPDLTRYFDSIELDVGSIEDWQEFEREFHEVS